MGTLTALLFTAATINVHVSADGREDGNSLFDIASFMKENFPELFQRLDSLESKVNRLVGKENCNPGDVGSRRGTLDHDTPNVFNETRTVARSGSNESHIETSTKEVQRMHGIISECECVAIIYSVLKCCKPGIDEGLAKFYYTISCTP